MGIYVSQIRIDIAVDLKRAKYSKRVEEDARRAAERYLFDSDDTRKLVEGARSVSVFQDITDVSFEEGEPGEYEEFPPSLIFTFLFEG